MRVTQAIVHHRAYPSNVLATGIAVGNQREKWLRVETGCLLDIVGEFLLIDTFAVPSDSTATVEPNAPFYGMMVYALARLPLVGQGNAAMFQIGASIGAACDTDEDAKNQSVQLHWTGLPQGTRSVRFPPDIRTVFTSPRRIGA
jgi:hypothetical protein